MSIDAHETLWAHYNARGLSPELIARSFVAPKQFNDVALARSTVVLGPRGSGKTTLLRMLDPRALNSWNSDDAVAFQQSVNYVGAFVPIDAPWISSLRQPYIEDNGSNNDDLAVAIYSLALGRSLIDVMLWRVTPANSGRANQFACELSGEVERTLSAGLSELWIPRIKARSLLELRLALTREIALLPRRWLCGDGDAKRLIHNIYGNPLELAVATCESFNISAGDSDRVWALLCDELEIAPPAIQRILFNALRAPSKTILLKLAFSPALKSPLSLGIDRAAPSHDYDVVSLSYPTREEGPSRKAREEFCKAIWKNLVSEKFPDADVTATNPYVVFEDYKRKLPSKHGMKSIASSGRERTREAFISLSRIDASFAHYLKDKRVNLENFDDNSQETFDAVIRKIRPIVETRLHYLRPGSEDAPRRASKISSTLYCGAERLFALSEGHPRWLKSTLGSMLDGVNGSKPRISAAVQAKEIDLSVARLESRIRAFPVGRECTLSTYSLICKVGDHFESQILGREFHADPVLSFSVDSGVPDDALDCLEKALYVGALIPMQAESGAVFYDGIRDHRFRLSNWLAPKFRLPLMTGKAVRLSTILGSRGSSPKTKVPTPPQLQLGLADESDG